MRIRSELLSFGHHQYLQDNDVNMENTELTNNDADMAEVSLELSFERFLMELDEPIEESQQISRLRYAKNIL
jgi:hypothetical protein